MKPLNLHFDDRGCTCLRYWTAGGVRTRIVPYPAALLTAPPAPEAEVSPRTLATPAEALFQTFRALPLRPDGPWVLAGGDAFPPVWRKAFAALLRLLRRPPAERWCVRGEPGWFLQFGLRETDGAYTMGAFVLPNGKPAVLTFRPCDLIEALPPAHPFATMDIVSEADGLAARTDPDLPWDTRVRLPIATPGGALLTLRPNI